jgi:hypothetical protein
LGGREHGGGYLNGRIVHQLGLALALIDAPPREVFARLDLLDSGVDIAATVSVQFEDGMIGSFSGQGRLPWNTRYPLGLRIAGDRGVMTLDSSTSARMSISSEAWQESAKSASAIARSRGNRPGSTCNRSPASACTTTTARRSS